MDKSIENLIKVISNNYLFKIIRIEKSEESTVGNVYIVYSDTKKYVAKIYDDLAHTKSMIKLHSDLCNKLHIPKIIQSKKNRGYVEISIDEYPFGIALEIENKSNDKDPEVIVKKRTELLGLNIKDAYRLSWDDKYTELCKEQGVEHYNHVTFDLPMPKVLD